MQTDSTGSANADAVFFARMRSMIRSLNPKTSKHDLVLILLTASIEHGINTRPRLLAAMSHLGFNPRHAVMILNDCTGCDPSRHHWQRDKDGIYSNHAQGIDASAIEVPRQTEAQAKPVDPPSPISAKAIRIGPNVSPPLGDTDIPPWEEGER